MALKNVSHTTRRTWHCVVMLTALWTAGCCNPSSWRGAEPDMETEFTWAYARAKVLSANGEPAAVVIDLRLVEPRGAARLSLAAFALARIPGVVTIDGCININLPEREGYPEPPAEKNIVVTGGSHDPSLSRSTALDWAVTIPLRSIEAKAALRRGAPVVIAPDSRGLARPMLRGIAFEWTQP